MYEIQHYTLCDGWVNTWSDDNGQPIRYGTMTEANEALNEYFDDLQVEVSEDNIDAYDRDEFRVQSVAMHLPKIAH